MEPSESAGFRVLVLCAGNIGRSPLTAAMLRSELAGGLEIDSGDLQSRGVFVDSAGTDAPAGHPASRRAGVLAEERGLDLSGDRARRVTADDLEGAHVILCMDGSQVAAVASLTPQVAGKVRLLAGDGVEIPDPHHESDGFFSDVAAEIETAVRGLAPSLLRMVVSRTAPDGET